MSTAPAVVSSRKAILTAFATGGDREPQRAVEALSLRAALQTSAHGQARATWRLDRVHDCCFACRRDGSGARAAHDRPRPAVDHGVPHLPGLVVPGSAVHQEPAVSRSTHRSRGLSVTCADRLHRGSPRVEVREPAPRRMSCRSGGGRRSPLVTVRLRPWSELASPSAGGVARPAAAVPSRCVRGVVSGEVADRAGARADPRLRGGDCDHRRRRGFVIRRRSRALRARGRAVPRVGLRGRACRCSRCRLR